VCFNTPTPSLSLCYLQVEDERALAQDVKAGLLAQLGALVRDRAQAKHLQRHADDLDAVHAAVVHVGRAVDGGAAVQPLALERVEVARDLWGWGWCACVRVCARGVLFRGVERRTVDDG
jgi:hypothetical protein